MAKRKAKQPKGTRPKGKATSAGKALPKSKATSKGEAASKGKVTLKRNTMSKKSMPKVKALPAVKTKPQRNSKPEPTALSKPVRPKATREDLLGIAARPPRIPPKWRDYHHKLLEVRDLIYRQQAGLSRNEERARAGTGMHMADAGTDSFDQDMTLGILSSDRDTLFQIDRALQRINDGTYGICEITGKPISANRLEAIPWTRFTAEAERQLEREGLHNRARLPSHEATGLGADLEVPEGEEAE